jgi:ATP-dependent DNA helicase PIF1
MRSLSGRTYRYDAIDTGTATDQSQRDKLLSHMMAPKILELKLGAQVMLIKNIDDGLVNGSIGKVVGFMSPDTFEVDENPTSLEGAVEPVADKGGRGTARPGTRKESGPRADRELPLVAFTLSDQTLRHLLVMPEEWKIELPSGEVQAQRAQLPLILAWALSIHKAQGQTLERVKIDLKRVFENGQAYVALSRAVSQQGLEVYNFDRSKVMAHPRVVQFYNGLYRALEHPVAGEASGSEPSTRA